MSEVKAMLQHAAPSNVRFVVALSLGSDDLLLLRIEIRGNMMTPPRVHLMAVNAKGPRWDMPAFCATRPQPHTRAARSKKIVPFVFLFINNLHIHKYYSLNSFFFLVFSI
jgi:hypothetical protein